MIPRAGLGKGEMVRPSRAAASPKEVPVADILVWAELVAEGLNERSHGWRSVEVGNGDQHIQDRLGTQSGHCGAPRVMDRQRRQTERSPELLGSGHKQSRPPQVIRDDPNGPVLQAQRV
jgi:hypothetical protein